MSLVALSYIRAGPAAAGDGQHLPELAADLISALPGLDAHNLPHDTRMSSHTLMQGDKRVCEWATWAVLSVCLSLAGVYV